MGNAMAEFLLTDRWIATIAQTEKLCYSFGVRGVAQPGSAPEWGSGGRRFESGRPDIRFLKININYAHTASVYASI